MNPTHYVPGVCNIGGAEIAARKKAGWLGLILTVIVWALLLVFNAGPVWYVLLLFGSALSASGFIQARMHFCAAFGLKHLFNLNAEVGNVERVLQKELWAADRRKALQIGAYSLLVGMIVLIAGLVMKTLIRL